MKKLFCSLILLVLLSCSCRINHPCLIDYKSQLAAFVDSYQNEYCNYPSSVDEFVSFSERVLPYADSASMDSLSLALNTMKEWREHVTWITVDDNYNDRGLLVLFETDTIIYKKTSAFPTLHKLIDAYRYYNFEYPDSYDVFRKCFLAMAKDESVWSTKVCDSMTMFDLERSQLLGNLLWILDEDGLLIMNDNDTLGYWQEYSYCSFSSFDIRGFESRFIDSDGVGFISTTLNDELKRGIRNLRSSYRKTLDGGIDGWHLLTYTPSNGIKALCKDDEIVIDSEWFYDLERFLKSFATNNKIEKIVFTAAAMEK